MSFYDRAFSGMVAIGVERTHTIAKVMPLNDAMNMNGGNEAYCLYKNYSITQTRLLPLLRVPHLRRIEVRIP